jgi:hypothetical protein
VADPTPEAELALLLAGTRTRRQRAGARIAELAERIDEDAFVAFLVDQRMLLLAATRLAELAPHALSEEFNGRLAEALTTARAGGMLFATASRHLTQALERESIPAVELKGAALAGELHGDEALRAYADIDVLVPAEALDDAVVIASRLGWNEPAGAAGAGLPTLHRWLNQPEGTLPVVELHWRVHWYETRFARAMLARSRLVDGARRLEPVDQLAALLLFYARDGFTGLRLAADVAAWWDLHGDGEVASRLESLISQHPELAEAWRAAIVAVSPLAGLPAGALPASLRPRDRRAALACRLRNWDLRGETDQIKANVTLVDGLLAPRDELGAFARRHVVPSLSFLADAYGPMPDSRVRVAGWRAWHAAKLAGRYGLAAWGLRQGRYWSSVPPGAQTLLDGL